MKINKEGYTIIAVTLVAAAAVTAVCFMLTPAWVAWSVTALAAGYFAMTVFFFREPRRPLLQDPDVVFSPCDGRVVVVEPVREREFLDGAECVQVSVFMNVTNVHVNWYPVGGRVAYFKHHHGRFMVAWHPKSSEENERTTTVVDTGRHRVLFRQIAGLVARRIVSYAREGETVTQNSKCGFIKFGSRVDVMLPAGSEVLVKIGDRVKGSQTPLARLP
ncbi:MAG: phosphatidylserine decarboxylase family protein [Rikenellaceae bacterium]|nr:phosphatidylserine decarboxylase family protein [Rikenellaceae bacterium]MCL2692870.1 phosphatidylserine decarboxylase family protein [Rikenellaceae bacterium]